MPVSYRFGQQSGISGKASYEEKCYYDYAAFHCLRRLNINLLTKMAPAMLPAIPSIAITNAWKIIEPDCDMMV